MDENLRRLINAARFGNLDEVKNVVSAENLNAEGPLGMTVLGEACRAEQTNVVRFLLEAGADIGDILNLSCEYKDVHSVRLLITSGMDLDRFDKYGKTPLHIAVERQSEVIVEALLKHGASVDKVDSQYGRSPLHIACETECLAIVTLLLGFGARLDLKDSSSRTPLHIACAENKSVDVLVTLAHHGAVADEHQDRYGDTALHIACDRGRIDMVRILLQHGASVNVSNRKRLTPLHLSFDCDDIISILLDYGCGMQLCTLHSCVCRTSVVQCLYDFHYCNALSVDKFERYFIKVEAAGIHYAHKCQWDPVDSERWGQPERESFLAECKDEIEILKILKVEDTSSTYYDLLCRKKSALQNYEIIGRLSIEVLGEFPIYGDMLHSSYLKIPEFLIRQLLVDKCSSFFELTPFRQLPPELVPLILDYLALVDLENLTKICEASRPRSDSVDIDGRSEVAEQLNAMSLGKCNATP